MKEATEPWIIKAEEDLKAAGILFDSGDFPSVVVCFHAQQAVEKYLKAYLTENDIEFRRTHDLVALLDEYCLDLDKDFNDFRERLQGFSYYATGNRYPGVNIPPSVYETKQAIDMALKIKDFVLDRLV
jgi:HEPN domain-containing protein